MDYTTIRVSKENRDRLVAISDTMTGFRVNMDLAVAKILDAYEKTKGGL